MPKELVRGIHGTFAIDPQKERKLYKQMKEYGAHQRNELAMLLSFIKEGDVVVDVGAHIGLFSLAFSTTVGPLGKVYAFEPLPETFSTLLENIKTNGALNIEPVQEVVGGLNEKVSAIIPQYAHSGASFSKVSFESTTEAITSISLDKFIKKIPVKESINLIKIDTEGMEYDVLLGAEETLSKHCPILYFEVNTRQTKSFFKTAIKTELFLRRFGYTFFKNLKERNSDTDVYEIGKVPILLFGGRFGDILAIPKGHALYPKKYSGAMVTFSMIIKRKIKKLFK
jgi:FkbM family methyltransferase